MDLNINNYLGEELLEILDVDDTEELTIPNLQTLLFTKINRVKEADVEELTETKEELITFFTQAFFKIVNDKGLYSSKDDEEFISVQENLLPKLQETPVVQQNNSMIAQHVNNKPLLTWNTHLKSGFINPLERRSIKKVLNINTRFRENYQTTKSTDFIINLPSTVKKVVSMKLKCTELPKTVYTFSSNLGSNYFKIGTTTPLTNIDISNGSYSPTDLTNTINPLIAAFDVSLNYNNNTGKMTFINTSGNDFYLDFNYNNNIICPNSSSKIDNNQLTLGWMLGFRGRSIVTPNAVPTNKWTTQNKINCCQELDYPRSNFANKYRGEKIYTSEGIFDGHGTRYFLLSINDFQNNHNEIFVSAFKNQSLSDNNVLAKISTACCDDCSCEHTERVYFGPVDITKLHIKLFDEFGRLIDINNADYSFTLELELLYDL